MPDSVPAPTPDHRRSIAIAIAVVIMLGGLVAVRQSDRGGEDGDGAAAESSSVAAGDGSASAIDDATPADETPADDLASGTAPSTSGSSSLRSAGRAPSRATGSGGNGIDSASEPAPTGSADAAATGAGGSRTPLPGVAGDEITVAYYWKGDRTRTSPYLTGTGAEGNVDEAEAFRGLIDYINANAGGGASLMGHPINLHGRKLKAVVVEAGQDAEDYAVAAAKITEEIKPFAAVAAHGSVSAYLCPTLAKAGIHNFATYDLAGSLASSTGGYCLPSGMTWEQQVELTEGYLVREQRAEPDRVYGVVYAEYPGLVDSAPKMVERLKKAGVRIGAVATLSASLTTAQQQAGNVVARMRAAGVDTIVMPDAGAPINFTHTAQAQGYAPDYYVWPCSGQDTMGMVRILNAAQWARAEGLTCYDPSFTSDLTISTAMRKTEWFRAYQAAAPGKEPPAPTPFVYAALLPLVAGLEGAGPDLTLETFRAALDRAGGYRYDAAAGRTDSATSLLLGLGSPTRALITDGARLKYNAARQEPGAAAPGWYEFPEKRRYAAIADFGT